MARRPGETQRSPNARHRVWSLYLTPSAQQAQRERRQRLQGIARRDRLALVAILAVQTLWSVCLWVLAGESFGCCWAGMVEMAAAELAAVAVGLALPDYVVRLVFLAAGRFAPADALAMQMALAGKSPGGGEPSARNRWLLYLLAGTGAACVVGGLASTAGIYLAGWAMGALAGAFLLPDVAWAVVRLALEVLAMLPLGLALAGLVLTGSLLRRFAARDPYRLLTRDVVWASSAGLAAAACAWWAGLNLLGVALACPVLVAGMLLATVTRREGGVMTAALSGPDSAGGRRRRQRWLNAGAWALLTATVVLQCRALRDAGADWAWTWLWAAGGGAALAMAAGRLEKRVRPGGAMEFCSAVAGMALLAALQVALLALAAMPTGWGALWILLAAAGQLPVAYLAATMLDRRRRLLAATGYAGRSWLVDAAAGGAAGAYLPLAILSAPRGALLLAVGGMALLAGAVLAGAGESARGALSARTSRTLRGQARWTFVGTACIAGLVLLAVGATQAGKSAFGQALTVGPSWTALATPEGASALPQDGPPPAGDPDLALLLARVIQSHPGRWWLVGAGAEVLMLERRQTALAQVSFPDSSFAALSSAAGKKAKWSAGFPRQVITQTARFDGICLTGLGADHPDAWCLYNRQVLDRCLGNLTAGGLLVVHTSAGGDALGDLMAVAETFRSVCPGHAAVVPTGGGLEMLLVGARGPEGLGGGDEVLARQAEDLPVHVMTIEKLLIPDMEGRGLSILTARGRRPETVSMPGFLQWLARQENKESLR